MALVEINRSVGTPYFNRLKSEVTALTKAGYTVYLNTHLNLVVGEEKKALHQKFYPKSPLVLVNLSNLPQSIEEIETGYCQYSEFCSLGNGYRKGCRAGTVFK